MTPPPLPLRRAAAFLPGDTPAQKAVFILLILAGATVRLALLGDIPAGLNRDEALSGYNAWAILEYGVDQHGYENPVHLIGWGGGLNALYGYLSMPFIKTLGLNELSVRLAQALLGVLSLFVMYYVGRRLAGGQFALFAMFALAISPWHIMMSRWGLESNLLPSLLLLSFAFLLRGCANPPRPAAVIPAFFLLGLALYAYGTAYLFVPLFTLGVLVYGLKSRLISLKHWGIGLAVMAIIAIPIALLILINLFDWEPVKTSFISIPQYDSAGRYNNISALFKPDASGQIWRNTRQLLDLLISGHDKHFYNALPEFGYFYRVGFYLSLLGAMAMVYDLVKSRGRSGRLLMLPLIWLAAALLLSITVLPNINRINVLWMPQIICAAYGMFRLWSVMIPYKVAGRRLTAVGRRRLPKIAAVALVIYLTASFAAFTGAYFDVFRQTYLFFADLSYGDALRHILRHTGENETIYLTSDVMYSHTLFHSKTDQRIYLETVQIPDQKVESQQVKSFGPYAFGINGNALYHGKVFLPDNLELALFPESDCDIARFRYYSAVYCRRTLYDAFLSGHYAKLADRATFDIYQSGNRLTYYKEPCDAADTESRFFLHLFPANPDNLPEERRPYGFDNRDFHFNDHGGVLDGKCLTIVPLPGYEIVRIRTGQYLPGGEQLWRADFPVGP